MSRVAIIGAGLSGLVLARRLRDVAAVTVFEKSRGVGGRMATRYAGDYEFDHGAQFFTARTRAFREFLEPLIDEGVIANWRAEFAELDREGTRERRSWGNDYSHFVGTPGMNAVGKYLSQGLEIVTETHIVDVSFSDRTWTLIDGDGRAYEEFDWLVLAAPPAQAANLAGDDQQLIELCEHREMLACFALMLGFDAPLDLPWQAALVRDADISWMSVNSSKPERKQPFTMLVHSTNAWARAHIDNDLDTVRQHMLDEAAVVSGIALSSAEHQQVHRWRYANIAKQDGPKYYLNASKRLAACGDWFLRGRIEAAFTSSHALASRLLDRL